MDDWQRAASNAVRETTPGMAAIAFVSRPTGEFAYIKMTPESLRTLRDRIDDALGGE